MLGPVLGAIIGGASYNFLISNVWSCQNVKSIECCVNEMPTVTTTYSGDEEERKKNARNQNDGVPLGDSGL